MADNFPNADKQRLEENNFIRHKLYNGQTSIVKKYKSLVTGDNWIKWARYELISLVFGSIPGPIGLLLRKLVYPCLFRKAGKGINFGRNVVFRYPEKIEIGNQVFIDDYCFLDARGAENFIKFGDRVLLNRNSYVQAKVGDIIIGDDTSVGAYAKVISQGPITIDTNVSIAGGAAIAGGRFIVDKDDHGIEKGRFTAGAIFIGKNSLIGMGSVIQDGVTVGENAIVGPNSVVINDVDANSVVIGNPAHTWRSRHPRKPDMSGAPADSLGKPSNMERYVIEVKEYLAELFFIDFDDNSFALNDSLIDKGYMDSVGLIRILSWLEKKYEYQADFSTIVPEDYDTVIKLAEHISNHISEQ
jgi:acetyltransferase-like isoleucine patch superfamily enzyme/acyl carrier protein